MNLLQSVKSKVFNMTLLQVCVVASLRIRVWCAFFVWFLIVKTITALQFIIFHFFSGPTIFFFWLQFLRNYKAVSCKAQKSNAEKCLTLIELSLIEDARKLTKRNVPSLKVNKNIYSIEKQSHIAWTGQMMFRFWFSIKRHKKRYENLTDLQKISFRNKKSTGKHSVPIIKLSRSTICYAQIYIM